MNDRDAWIRFACAALAGGCNERFAPKVTGGSFG